MDSTKIRIYKPNQTSYKKGHIAWNEGKHHSKEARLKMRNKMLVWLKTHKPAMTGRKQSEKCMQALRNNTHGFKKGMIPWNKGKKHSEETKEKMRLAKLRKPVRYWLNKKRLDITGKNNHLWKGGISSERDKLRGNSKIITWRKSVFRRDNYTCQLCGSRGNLELHAHHIKKFADFPKLRSVLENGITLCKKCHLVGIHKMVLKDE